MSGRADHRDTMLMALPGDPGRVVMLNAAPLPGDALRDVAVCEQGFRSTFLALERAGYTVEPSVDGSDFDTAMVLLERSKAINERNIARAWNAVRADGSVLVAGDTKSSIKSLRKRVGTKADLVATVSKHHAVAFRFLRSGEDWPVPELAANAGEYTTRLGTFSADRIDAGSKILARYFDAGIRGCVADFGAGWGYLSAELLKVAPDVGSIALFEASHEALLAARENLAPWQATADFKWIDVPSEYGNGAFNHVIMNPPFHTDRAADPSLGKAFIAAAARALMPRGTLLMVANRNLPYEADLKARFRSFETLADEGGFKVIRAVKG